MWWSNLQRFCLVFSLLVVASCGGSGSSGGGEAAPEPNEPVIVPDEPLPEPDDSLEVAEFDPHWGTVGVFDDAASCGVCHSASTDGSGVLRYPATAAGQDISPYAGWRHSAMAHAFDDPYFQAKMEDETIEFPAIAGTIEDKCLTCHTPMARTHAHATGMLTPAECLDESGCYRLEDAEASMMAREAVSCTLCHQIDGEGIGEAFSGSYQVDPDALVIYGPYDDPLLAPMAHNTQYSLVGSAHVRGSALCATCHDLDTPSVDVVTGELTGRYFVEQAPYREWRNSQFNIGSSGDRQCQDCHMPTIEGYRTALATSRSGVAVPGWPLRDDYSQHNFLGGNTYLLSLLVNYREELGISNTTTQEGFTRAITANEGFLAEQAARVSISAVDLANDQLDIDVTVENLAGHKLPTSFPSRRVWVNLIVTDDNGNVLFESGTPDADGLLEQDAAHSAPECVKVDQLDGEAKCFSPHRNIITAADEVVVYEAVMGDTLGRVASVLLYGDRYLKDNRIPPAGFTVTDSRYDPVTKTVGAALSDPDFNIGPEGEGSGTDVVHYRLDWSDMPESGLQFEAVLYYQSLRPAFAAGLQHSGARLDRFRGMYDALKPRAIPLGRAVGAYP